jgi:hypothetical protein
MGGQGEEPRAEMILDKALTWFISIWLSLFFLMNAIAIIWFVFSAETIWDGIGKVQEVYSPFNVANWIVEVIVASPALGAIAWLERRRARQ